MNSESVSGANFLFRIPGNSKLPLGAIALLQDHTKLANSQLPIVTEFSCLSRHQRKKYPNWATDPHLTRARMEAARELVKKGGLEGVTISNQSSLLEGLRDDIDNSEIPDSQAFFDVEKAKDSLKYLPMHNADDVENLYEDEEQRAIVESIGSEEGSEKIEYLGKSDNKKQTKIDSNKTKEWRVKGSKKPTFRLSNTKREAMTSESSETNADSVDFNIAEFKEMVTSKFQNSNVNPKKEFMDELVYFYNTKKHVSQDMVDMYISGIKKERQISSLHQTEGITENLLKLSSALQKQLDTLKQQVGTLSKVKPTWAEDYKQAKGESSSIVNPLQDVKAPSK
ncbi:TPA_asm: P [Pueraria betacytorhabdovirus 1]|nr:TPA_asm: P [Pueraria betacytorhabdovirus 1]